MKDNGYRITTYDYRTALDSLYSANLDNVCFSSDFWNFHKPFADRHTEYSRFRTIFLYIIEFLLKGIC